jgi:phage tail-like protein
MAESGKEQSKTIWPLVKFRFSVKIGDKEAFFQEVTGLSDETQQIEYRKRNNKEFSTIKMPGLNNFGNVTLKKGIFKDDTSFWDLYNAVKMSKVKPEVIVISLLDENNDVAMSWKLANALPSKITATDMKSDANDLAVESMELTHEGLSLV